MAHILLASKDTPVRKAVRAMLVSTGYDVTCADHGAAALLLSQQLKFDLLLTDYRLPLVDGVALTISARKANPHLKVMMMSNTFGLDRTLASLDVWIDSVMQKPFSIQDLRNEVARVLPGRLRVA